jgi:hypothetical protein
MRHIIFEVACSFPLTLATANAIVQGEFAQHGGPHTEAAGIDSFHEGSD